MGNRLQGVKRKDRTELVEIKLILEKYLIGKFFKLSDLKTLLIFYTAGSGNEFACVRVDISSGR